MQFRKGGFEIDTDPSRIDANAVQAYLSRSYWAQNIPLKIVQRSFEHSLNFGLFHEGRQIGFARIISDRATFAYLCDVYVLEEFRGQGLSKWMMEVIRDYPELQGLRRWVLGTRDAHGLYRQFGFKPLANPDRFMEIATPNIYS